MASLPSPCDNHQSMGGRSERTQGQAVMVAWNSFNYICTRALHSFRSFAHCHSASTVISLLPKATNTPSIQPNIRLPRTNPPLTSAINILLVLKKIEYLNHLMICRAEHEELIVFIKICFRKIHFFTMKDFSECWSFNRLVEIKQYLDLIHSFNRHGQKKRIIYESQSKTNLLNRNKHCKIQVTMSLKKVADKILDTAALMYPHFS